MTPGRGRPIGETGSAPEPAVRSSGYAPRGRPKGAILRGRGIRDAAEGASSGPVGVLRFVVFSAGLAALVLVVLFTVGAPILRDAVYGLATSRPDSMRWPFVADVVRERLGADLTEPVGGDATSVHFLVSQGATATQTGLQLEQDGLIRNRYAFVYLAITENVSATIQAGAYRLNATMTPQQIVDALQSAPLQTVTIRLREGLRLEQITAYLETLPLQTDVARFYDLASHPPATLLAEFPWLKLPDGRSLEGFLYPDTYEVYADITPTELIRKLVTQFHDKVGDELLGRIESSGRTLYEVVTLASLVDREAKLDQERPLIAGVFQSRLDKGMALASDPTIIYARDTMELAKLTLPQWVSYYFWDVVPGKPADFRVSPELQGYQTYQSQGLPPGPIDTPRVTSIEAALEPDTSTGYLYFVAIPDGSGQHAFAKTLAEHLANLAKYGYPT